MSINIEMAETDDLRPRITVIGVGGAGGNAIANMIGSEIEGVEFIVANTDAQSLNSSPAEKRIQLGAEITQGLGAGAKPEVGKAAAEETASEIEEALQGVNMVFIAAGMGGGTGTGAAPVIAQTARAMGILTVGVVTKPFLFEGTRRMRAAEAGIDDLQEHVDTLIVIPNQNLFLIASQDTTFKEAFAMADEVLQQGVRSITDLMVMPGLINLDFADVRSVMSEMGKAMMGTGEAEGDNRAKEAAEKAINNPLLDRDSMHGAKGVIISIIGGEDMKLFEVDGAATHIRNLVDEDANIIWGSALNPELEGRIRVSVVATGIEQEEGAGPVPRSAIAPAAMPAAMSPAMPTPRAPQRPVLDLIGEAEPEVDVEPDTDFTTTPDPLFEAEPEAIEPEPIHEEPASFPPITLTPPDPVAYEPEPLVQDGAADEMFTDPEPEPPLGFDAEPAADSFDDTFGAPEAGDALFLDPVTEAQEAEEDHLEEAKPFDLSGMRDGDEMGEPEGEDVDEIIDPLAGLRGADDDELDLGDAQSLPPLTPPRQQNPVYSELDHPDGQAPVAPAEPAAPVAPPEPPAETGGGSTLFERMANLSRSSSSHDEDDEEDEDDGDEGGAALSIPRFLGRQNNQ